MSYSLLFGAKTSNYILIIGLLFYVQTVSLRLLPTSNEKHFSFALTTVGPILSPVACRDRNEPTSRAAHLTQFLITSGCTVCMNRILGRGEGA